MARKKKHRTTIILMLILVGLATFDIIALDLILPRTQTWEVEETIWDIYVMINREGHELPLQAHSSGSDKNPKMPKFVLHEGEKVSKQTASYTVIGVRHTISGEKRRSFTFDYETWSTIKVGDRIKTKNAKIGGSEIVIERR